MVIVKTGIETAKRYKGKAVVTKVGNKKHQVYFKVYCDDVDIAECVELYKSSSNILMLEYQGTEGGLLGVDLSNVYIAKVFDFGTNIVEEDIISLRDTQLPEGVVAVLRLPQEYCDMQFMYDMSQKYKDIRFCGGTVFCIDDCRLGCCGRDILNKRGVKYDTSQYFYEGCCCAAETFLDTDVELEEGKVSKKSGGKGSSASKKTLMFKDLLFNDCRAGL